MSRILVTGGAGYIGSHVASVLIERGFEVVVIDNLTTGHEAAVPGAAILKIGDVRDQAFLDSLFREYKFEGIMHFASHSLVGESMLEPFKYLSENVAGALALLASAARYEVKKFVLSSTANLFDNPPAIPIDESAPIRPGSPYGESKYMIERCLKWAERCHDIRYATLRYFNAAGAEASGVRGEDHNPETHLIPNVLKVALGQRDEVQIFGDDYDTPDGTCIRDYVHVSDLAEAHLLALAAIEVQSCCYNLGSGNGFSVREVVRSAEEVTGLTIASRVTERRPGDPAKLVAGSERIRSELGWEAKKSDLNNIMQSAWHWHKAHPKGFGKIK